MTKTLFPERLLLLCAWLSAVMTCLCSCIAWAQQSQLPKSKQEIPALTRYYKVLNLAFPPKCVGEFCFVLRFHSPFEPESQIVISKDGDAEYQITSFELPAEAGSIADQTFGRDASEKPEDIARQIRVEVRRVSVPVGTVEQWVKEYSELRFSPKLETRVMMDATRYDLWYFTTSASHEFHFSFRDVPVGEENSRTHPLVRWMNRVRYDVYRASKASLKAR